MGITLTLDHYPHGLSWIKTPLETLGIYISNNSLENFNYNFKPKIATLCNTLNIWKQRTLSIKGKITIINTLALSPLIYTSSLIYTPKEALKEINNIIQTFICEAKTAQMSQNTLIKNINEGGLKLCHYPVKVKALKLSWIKRLCDESDANWKCQPKHFYNCNDLNLYFSANHTLLKRIKEIPSFYKDIHDLYMNNFKKEPTTAQDILEQSIWLNDQITINNKCIHWESWKKTGILYINDIINPSNGHFFHHMKYCKINST